MFQRTHRTDQDNDMNFSKSVLSKFNYTYSGDKTKLLVGFSEQSLDTREFHASPATSHLN